VIPKIITTDKRDNINEIISGFAKQCDIDLSHRMVISPEKNELTVEQIHLMQKDIQVMFSKKILVVLQGVDDSGNEVQNSLLKCLEEDSERIQFLFLVKNPALLLPTILSRCALTGPRPFFHKSESFKSLLDIFSFQNNSDATKETAVGKIDAFIASASVKNNHTLHNLLTIRKLIIDNNINPVLALDNILIFFSKTSTMNVIHGK